MSPLLALLGFAIAFAVGLTGAGGGSLAVPAFVLLGGMQAGEAIGTAMVFAAALKLVAAPLFLHAGQVNGRALRLLLAGALPGLLLGGALLAVLSRAAWLPAILVASGLLVALSGVVTLGGTRRRAAPAPDRTHWLPWLALPLGVEIGFSSIGSGALGTALLLHCAPLEPAAVVGTDLCFGLVAMGAGALFHWRLGFVSAGALPALLLGGLPGLWLGVKACTRFPARRVRAALAVVLLAAGFQLCAAGWRRSVQRTPEATVEHSVRACVPTRVRSDHPWASLATTCAPAGGHSANIPR